MAEAAKYDEAGQDRFKTLCTEIIANAHEHPGDGLRALSAALNLVMLDREMRIDD